MKSTLFSDRNFYKSLLRIALPITIQQFITSGISTLDVLMVGQLGETSIAALGLANQVYFLLQLLLFGVSSGSAIFTAQYWGVRDVKNIRRVLGICLFITVPSAVLFTIAAMIFPEVVLRFYTDDPAVIALGSQYLRVVGVSYLLFAISFSYAAILRSTEQVKLPMVVSAMALILNSLLNYALIFGNFGLPAMGVRGAALGTTISRGMEFVVLVFLTYRLKTSAAARLRELLDFNFAFFKRTLHTSMPAAINEVLWALGITTYNSVYAHIGTQSIAAMNIANTIESMAFVVFMALAHGAAIMIGNKIGAGHETVAREYAGRFLKLGVLGALVTGTVVILVRQPILLFYNITPVASQYASNILLIFSLFMWVKVSNLLIFVGILRSGGDTRYALLVEACAIWLVGVPLALTGGFVLRLPVHWVYLMVFSEEFVKLFLVYRRYRTGRWIHNLVREPEPVV